MIRLKREELSMRERKGTSRLKSGCRSCRSSRTLSMGSEKSNSSSTRTELIALLDSRLENEKMLAQLDP